MRKERLKQAVTGKNVCQIIYAFHLGTPESGFLIPVVFESWPLVGQNCKFTIVLFFQPASDG